MGYNNTSYKNEKGKDIPANADIKYRKNYFGLMLPSSSEAATDTIITLTPDAPGATTQRIHLSGKKSKSEHLDDAGLWVPSQYQNYWIPVGREAVKNFGNQPSYWNQFLNKAGFKQQGGTMQQQMQGQATTAKWGAKLSYIKSLKYAKGGKTCLACQTEVPTKKVEEKACGGKADKAKKVKKRYFGGWL